MKSTPCLLIALAAALLAGCAPAVDCAPPAQSSPIPPGTYSGIFEAEFCLPGLGCQAYADVSDVVINDYGFEPDRNGCSPYVGDIFVFNQDGTVGEVLMDSVEVTERGYTLTATMTSYGEYRGTGTFTDSFALLDDGRISNVLSFDFESEVGTISLTISGIVQ